jgi:preprotein translocase subunit SecF
MGKFESWYDKRYKQLLILPAVLLFLSLLYIGLFYVQTGDVVSRDVSLTGGTSVSLFTDRSVVELNSFLDSRLSDYDTKVISDASGSQIELVIVVQESDTGVLLSSLEEWFGEPLSQDNSSVETTSASLSSDFYHQLVVAIILAFFWMSAIVFIIFARGSRVKTKVVVLNILFGFFLGSFFFSLPPFLSGIIFLLFAGYLIRTYVKFSIPAFAVILSAFADMVMTLAVVNLIGMSLSTAGVVAFLMLIGYSVDTDILLTTRLLRKRDSVNKTLWGAFKTGSTMTFTSIIAVASALIAVYSFGSVLNQIFTILLIGLGFDVFNTWITNASMMKWYVEAGGK